MAEKNILPNLKAKASDGNAVFTPEQWLEQFRQITEREHKIYTSNIKRRRRHRLRMDMKRTTYSRRFHLGSRTRSTVSNNPSRVQNGTGLLKNKRLYPVIHRILLPKTQ